MFGMCFWGYIMQDFKKLSIGDIFNTKAARWAKATDTTALCIWCPCGIFNSGDEIDFTRCNETIVPLYTQVSTPDETKVWLIEDTWRNYIKYLKKKYPAPEGKKWELNCPFHQKISRILGIEV